MANFKTRDVLLAEKLQKEGFIVCGIRHIDQKDVYEFKAEESLIIKHLGWAGPAIPVEPEEPKVEPEKPKVEPEKPKAETKSKGGR